MNQHEKSKSVSRLDYLTGKNETNLDLHSALYQKLDEVPFSKTLNLIKESEAQSMSESKIRE
jgi:hypothetical protein